MFEEEKRDMNMRLLEIINCVLIAVAGHKAPFTCLSLISRVTLAVPTIISASYSLILSQT